MNPIRFASRLGDRPELLAAVTAGFQALGAEWPQLMPRDPPPEDCAVAYCGPAERPDGFAAFQQGSHGRVWLDVLWVQPECRRRGIGGSLLDAVVHACRAEGGISWIDFGTALANTPFRNLAVKHGYVGIGLLMRAEVRP